MYENIYFRQMENIITISIVATVCFCIAKFVEMRVIDKETEMKPLKFFVRDAIIVFLSVVFAVYVYEHLSDTIGDLMNTVTETKILDTKSTEVFTDTPGF